MGDDKLFSEAQKYINFCNSVEKIYSIYINKKIRDYELENDLIDYTREIDFLNDKISQRYQFTTLCSLYSKNNDFKSFQDSFQERILVDKDITDIKKNLRERGDELIKKLFEAWDFSIDFSCIRIN